MDRRGPFFLGHIHDPYDTVETAWEVRDVLAQMAVVALSTAIELPQQAVQRIVLDQRAVILASHTESGGMTPAVQTEFGMTLSKAGFDVDLIPFGQPVSSSDLEGATLVITLPVFDLPASDDQSQYDESWSQVEIQAIQNYVQSGGLLVLTNSAHQLDMRGAPIMPNEDILAINALASQFGITFHEGESPNHISRIGSEHALTRGIASFKWVEDNGVAFQIETGQVLAITTRDPVPALALVDIGTSGGQVLVTTDITLFSNVDGQLRALRFWQNLAGYAKSRSVSLK